MKLANITPPLQDDGTVHPRIADRYETALDWLQGRIGYQDVQERNQGDKRLDRAVIEHLFNLVPITSMDAEQLQDEDGQRMFELLLECLKDGYFLKEIQRVSLESIASNHPNGIMAKTRQVNIGDSYRTVDRLPSKIDWLDLLIAKDPAMALRYLGGLNLKGMGSYVQDYFMPIGEHPSLLQHLDSQRALKFFKIFGWDQCKQHMREQEIAQALEIDLAL